jgi:Flp pilus assembly protein TadG
MGVVCKVCRIIRRVCSTLQNERGQDLLEVALGLPIMLTVLLGIMEFGLVTFTYNTVTNAAHEGARYGALHPVTTSGFCANPGAGIGETTCHLTSGLDSARVHYSAAIVCSTMQVEVTYVYSFITGPVARIVGRDGTLTLRAVASMQIE